MSLATDPIRRFSLAQLVSVGGGWVEWIGLFAAALALAGGLLATRLVEPLDALFYDAVVRVTPRTPDPRILIVRIDDPSLRSEGRWPWSRTLHASLIDRLSASGVASIGYDVLFVETGPGDDALAAAISRAGRVALPLLIEVPGDNGALFRETRPVVASASTGHVIVRADADGVFRRIVPVERAGAARWEHLALATARLSGAVLNNSGSLIPYAGPPGYYPSVSFTSVVRGEVPAELLRGRIILVGATAAGLGDRFATPVGGDRDLMSGVEVQANIVDAVLNGGLRAVAGFAICFVFAAAALAIMWAGFLFAGPRENLAIVAMVLAGVFAIAVVMLIGANLWIRPAAALVTIMVMFPLWGWRRLAAASRFLDVELDRLGGSDDDITAIGSDRITRQIALLDAASTRMGALRRQRDETLAFLSHDLRSPAAAILSLVPDNDRVAGHARRMLRLTDQFVQGVRAEEAPLVIELVELAALLDEATDQCWEAAERVGGKIDVDCSWDVPEISTDRALMARAIGNLIENALKYGGNTPSVRVRGWFANGQAVVSVADCGPGMESEIVARLFSRFERAGASRSEGFGLGLALVATFARRNDGQVQCISRPDIGTMFELALPVL